jgi:DDE superfamily endonuclease
MVRDAFSKCRTEIDYVPRGYTSRLQVMDVGVNKPFKCYACNIFDDWLVQHDTKKPTRQDVSMWISTAWEEVKEETLVNSWRRAMELSSGMEHAPDFDDNDSNTQNTQQSDNSVYDPLMLECDDDPTIFSDDDPDIP